MKHIKMFEEFIVEVTKTEGPEKLNAKSFAYTPDKSKPSTWKLRIDDAKHVSAAVAALGKGFRGNKVTLPAEDKEKVISKVRAAYKKFYPEKDLPRILQGKI